MKPEGWAMSSTQQEAVRRSFNRSPEKAMKMQSEADVEEAVRTSFESIKGKGSKKSKA